MELKEGEVKSEIKGVMVELKQNKTIDMAMKYIEEFKVEGSVVEYIGNYQNTGLFGVVPLRQVNIFVIKVVKTVDRAIWVGVIDSTTKGEMSVNWHHPHVIGYCGQNGGVAGDSGKANKTEGSGFKTGDKVRVTVNLEAGIVTWSVNGMKQASERMEVLKEKTVNWVPYVLMYTKGDSV